MPIPPKNYTVDIPCMICGAKIGQHTLDEKVWPKGTATPDAMGIVDNRCTTCENAYGVFKDMTLKVQTLLKKTPLQAEAFVKQYRKQADIDAQIAIQKPLIINK